MVVVILALIFTGKEQELTTSQNLDYNEKAKNFTLHKFKNGRVISTMSADEYKSYPAGYGVMTNAKIKEADYDISADKVIDNSDNLVLSGNVKIVNNSGAYHLLEAKELTITKDKNVMHSDNQTIYFYNKDKINSDGIEIINNQKFIKFIGDNIINSNNYQILTRNMQLYQQDKLYLSDNSSTFLSGDNKTTATKGFKLVDNKLNLFGVVKTTNNNATISATGMLIDSLTKTYKTKKNSKYNSPNLVITANEMTYLEQKQQVKLNGRVQANYD
jgi:lipopolysaccharide export system protein LptA